MSQSRARKPQSIGGDTVLKGRSMVKASGDSAPSAPHQSQPKQIQRSRSKNKIPKNIRYDLENALVGLCDVWFEDIKPHLVRNKIKLHVDTNGATASSDNACGRPATSGCSHLDPGAASDRLQQTYVSSAGCCSTQHTASRAPCRRPPAPRPPPPLRPPPSSPPTLPHSTSQNKNSKSKSRQLRRSRSKTQPALSPTGNWRVPRLCRTYSLLSPQASPRTQRRRIQTAAPAIQSRKESCLLSLVPCSRASTRNKYTQTDIPSINHMKRTRAEPMSSNIYQTQLSQHIINLMHPESGFSKNAVNPAQRRGSEKTSKSTKYHPLKSLEKRKTRENREPMVIDSVPSKTDRNQSPRKRSKKDHVPIPPVSNTTQQYRRRDNRSNTKSTPQQLHQTLEKRKVDPSIAPPARDKFDENRTNPSTPLPQPPQRALSPVTQPSCSLFWRCFATTNLHPLKNKKQEIHNQRRPEIEPPILFDKELIDIIGTKNDERLRMLYRCPSTREEFPSVMNLLSSLGSREKEIEKKCTKKTLHWR